MKSLLQVDNVTKKFGGLAAVSSLNIEIEDGAMVGLIGPNGAGKTTVFNLLTGVYAPTDGQITFFGQSLKHKKPYQIASMGIARTFQNIRLFKRLTVLDNVKVAAHLRTKVGLAASIFQTPRLHRNDAHLIELSRTYLDKLNLLEYELSPANGLPYGLQRRLEIARALATNPKLLLLDEPAAGMNPQEKQELMELIRSLRDEFKVTILLIEHDMKVVMGICERIYVLDYGQIIAEGSPEQIKRDQAVITAYLGEDAVYSS